MRQTKEQGMESQPVEHWHGVTSNDFHNLALTYGTPFFLYDADTVNDRIRSIRDSLAQQVKVFYAVKANPNLELLRAVQGVADGLDISSAGELKQARLASFDMAKLSFAGPAKTTAELTTAIKHGIGCLSIESVRELHECVDISKRLDIKANVVVRVNPQLLNRAFGMKMGGRAVQFGIDEEELDGALRTILANARYLNFQGVHIYAGSQCFEAAGIVEGVQNTLRIAEEIEKGYSLYSKIINLGGGFGVSHSENGREMNIDELSAALVPTLQRFHASSAVKREIVFELGRFLTADAGIYVARVISSKKSRGKTFFMVDGGLHHHLAAAGTFGAALRSNYVIKNLSRPDAAVIRCNIAGPSCNPTDLLGVDLELPQPEQGDLIAVLKAGSYGLTASPFLFLGRQTPAELVRRDSRVVLGRRSRSIIDFN
jgi:diaminopimelate decarboxylase